MRRLMTIVTAAAVTCVLAAALSAQQGQQTGVGSGGSPHWKADWTVHGAKIVVEYGRPYLKGRPEAQMMPPGKPWRTGADEATIITSDKPLKFGPVTLAAGTTYTINTQPGDQIWQLIIGKLDKPGQWGIPYQPALELGRALMTTGKTKAPVEQVTISIDATPTGGGTLRVEWGTTSASTAFTIG
jgi:hypothetical protein